jgi:hypothetical protein
MNEQSATSSLDEAMKLAYRQRVEQAIRTTKYNRDCYEYPNYGAVYLLDGGTQAAKVFFNGFARDEARKEFSNLSRLTRMSDPAGGDLRIRVPHPDAVLSIGRGGLYRGTMLGRMIGYPEQMLYAVIMEHIPGPSLARLDRSRRNAYMPALEEMLSALVEHGVWRYDLKLQDILTFPDSGKVCMVDTHTTGFDNGPLIKTHYDYLLRSVDSLN